MRKIRWSLLLVLFAIALPVLGCNDPTATRDDGTEDEEDEKRPSENDDTAFRPSLSAEPVVV